MPDGVETLGGELYFTDFTPGHGFVSSVGVPQAPASAEGEEAEPPHVDEQEKQDIMNLFRGH